MTFLVNVQSCDHCHNPILEHFSHLRRYLLPICSHPLSRPQLQATTNRPSVSISLPFLHISYKWNCMVCNLLHLSSFIYHTWPLRKVLLFLLYRWENWGLERLRDLPKVGQLVNDKGTGNWTHVESPFPLQNRHHHIQAAWESELDLRVPRSWVVSTVSGLSFMDVQ